MNDTIRSRKRVLESIHIRMAASLALRSAITGHRPTDNTQSTPARSPKSADRFDSDTAHLGLQKLRQAVAAARPDELTSRETVAAIRAWARAQAERQYDAEAADQWNSIFRDLGADPAVALNEAARMRARYSKAAANGCVGDTPRSVAWQIVA